MMYKISEMDLEDLRDNLMAANVTADPDATVRGFKLMAGELLAIREAVLDDARLDALQREAQIAGLGRSVYDLDTRLNAEISTLRKAVAAEKALADRNITNAARDILSERQRQIASEGWTPESDDNYLSGELANAAACYAMTDPVMDPDRPAPVDWPWTASWWKPSDRRRDLIKAGALILAEIERIDRKARGL